jgi:hypothetical protein
VEVAERLRAEVRERIAEALAGAAAPLSDVYVGWVAAHETATCPSRYRGQGERGWGFPGWSPVLAGGAVGRAALAHHLTLATALVPGGRPPPQPVPLDAIRTWMRALRFGPEGGGPPVEPSGVGDWIVETWESGDAVTLAAVAAAAGRWLAGFVRVLGWPLPDRLTLLGAASPSAAALPAWRPERDSPVRVAASADARIGRSLGSPGPGGVTLVVHRATTGDDGALADRAAFEGCAGALASGVAPAAVLVTAGDTGERVTVPVDDDVLARGAEQVLAVVEQRVRAVDRGFDPADATPSPACRHCEHLADCPPGQSWLQGPGRWRGGLPVLTPPRTCGG